jgi:hypothetical protein
MRIKRFAPTDFEDRPKDTADARKKREREPIQNYQRYHAGDL